MELLNINAGGGFLSFLCLIVGIYMLCLFFYLLLKGYQSAKWPSIEGIVSLNEIEYSHHGDSVAAYPKIVYEYKVNDQFYRSETIAFNAFITDDTNYLRKYKIGKGVIVYYNPKKNNQSVLVTGVHYSIYAYALCGITMITISIYVLIK